jgi:glycosyltransferase involved in cell wall biosynthesis
MKILHIITGLGTGGAEAMLQKLVYESSCRPENHVVVSLMGEGTRGQEIKEHASLYCLGLGQGRLSIAAFVRLFQIVKEENPDVIQGWMYHSNLAGFFVNIFFRKPLFWNIRHSLSDIKNEKRMTRFFIQIGAILSRFTKKVVYNSRNSIQQHLAIGYSGQNAVFIPNGFDLNVFVDASSSSFRSQNNLSEEAILLVHVARFHPVKNHKGLIQVLSSVLPQYSNLYCLMVGKDVCLGNKELEKLILRSGFADRYRLLGERNDLPTIYSAVNYTVNPSWGEGFPNVVGESMACGTPCIVSDVGDSKMIVGEFGFDFNPENESEFRRAIVRALELGRSEYNTLSNACRQRIGEQYTIAAIYSQYVNMYRNNL